jgi:hypothetical protein
MTSVTSNCARFRAFSAIVTNQSFVQLPVPVSLIAIWHVQPNWIPVTSVSEFLPLKMPLALKFDFG